MFFYTEREIRVAGGRGSRARQQYRRGGITSPYCSCNKALALIWYRALTWYCSPARPFAALDVPLLVTGQQGGASPACRQLSRARNACAGSSSQEITKLGHGTKLGRTLYYTEMYLPCGGGPWFPRSKTISQGGGGYQPLVFLYTERYSCGGGPGEPEYIYLYRKRGGVATLRGERGCRREEFR